MNQKLAFVARVAIAGSILSATAGGGRAAAQSAPPTAYLQDSTIVGSANTLTITRVPVISGGVVTYEDVTIDFTVGASGLQIAAGYPVVTSSPTLKVARFVAGSYVGPSNDPQFFITVSGPGTAQGGETVWSLQASSGANSATDPTTAMWYVGPLANNPNAARIKQAGITSTTMSYGVAGGITSEDCNFQRGALLGFAQTSNGLTIYSYTNCVEGGSPQDNPTPIDQITYTLKP